MSLVWPKEDQMDHVRNPKHSLPHPLTWPADESVRTLPCHRLPTQNRSALRCFRSDQAFSSILSYIRAGCFTQNRTPYSHASSRGFESVVPAIFFERLRTPRQGRGLFARQKLSSQRAGAKLGRGSRFPIERFRTHACRGLQHWSNQTGKLQTLCPRIA
jgi:hypothetical protein